MVRLASVLALALGCTALEAATPAQPAESPAPAAESSAPAESPGPAVAPVPAAAPATAEVLHVATFDSGFGGYLTAKSIEASAAPLLRRYDTSITVHHYGDTRNLPYGEKTPAQIAALGSAGVLKAFADGADMVFIACNTASTQYEAIRRAVDAAYPGQAKPVTSIIDVSTAEARRLLDAVLAHQRTARFAILATPATVRSMAYPRRLAALYGGTLTEGTLQTHTQPRWHAAQGATIDSLVQQSVITLPSGQRIDVYQLAPANWVELIEHGADLAEKHEAVRRDLGLLLAAIPGGAAPDVVGYFCTHYPIFDGMIRADLASRAPGAARTHYIAQGALMAKLFQDMAQARLKGHERPQPLSDAQLAPLLVQARPVITISGANGATTRSLARLMFPGDPEPVVLEQDLGRLEADSGAAHAAPTVP
jgi:glutamate racemase